MGCNQGEFHASWVARKVGCMQLGYMLGRVHAMFAECKVG